MLTTDPDEFLAAFPILEPRPDRSPTARTAFLVSPSGFSLATESASDNRYMDLAQAPDPQLALVQHATLAERLRQDVPVIVFPGDPDCPDGVFPNNVFATAPGRLIVGRMRHAVRRREADRHDIRGFFRDLIGYREVDLSGADFVAELTGALVIDRTRGIGFCGLSERCDKAGAEAMHEAFDLDLTFCFDLGPGEYHTNVIMALLAGRLPILAADGFADPDVPAAIAKAYGDAIALDAPQRHAYAGNAISLTSERVWMSARAAASLTAKQRAQLHYHGFAVGVVDLGEIEKAGGSLRCCVAEIF